MSMSVIVILTMLILMLLGTPVAWSIGMGCTVALLSNGGIPMEIMAQKTINSLDSFTLLAIPLFILAGELMNSGGITKRLVGLATALVGHMRGSLAQIGIVTNILMSGISGSGVADASATGSMLIPAMQQQGYGKHFPAAVMGAAATIGPIIPPSIPLVVYASISNESIGRLFLGGVLPGLCMGAAIMALTAFIAKKRNFPKPEKAPWSVRKKAIKDSLLAVFMPVLLVGSIASGIATPTESAIMTVWYAIFVGVFIYKEITFKDVLERLEAAAASIGVVCLVIAVSGPFGWLMAWENMPNKIVQLFSGITNPSVALLLVLLVVFILGMLLDGTPIIILTTPILLPMLKGLGVSPLHYGVLLAVNVMIGNLTPPVGQIMFVTSKISGSSMVEFIKDAWIYIVVLTATLILMVFVPQIVTIIPDLMMPAG